MACKINKDIFSGACLYKPVVSAIRAYVFNRKDITISKIANLINDIQNVGTNIGYSLDVAKNGAIDFGNELVSSDNLPDYFTHFVKFPIFENDAESLLNIDSSEDLVIIIETTTNQFFALGVDSGLFKSVDTNSGYDKDVEYRSDFELFSAYEVLKEDYINTKELLESLLGSQVVGAEITVSNLATFSAFISDPTGFVTIDFGDGTENDYVVSESVVSPTLVSYMYSTPFTGAIKILTNTISCFIEASNGILPVDLNFNNLNQLIILDISYDNMPISKTISIESLVVFEANVQNYNNLILKNIDLKNCISLASVQIDAFATISINSGISITSTIPVYDNNELVWYLSEQNLEALNCSFESTTNLDLGNTRTMNALYELLNRGWSITAPNWA